MKTPMQELISVIRKRQEDEDVQPFMWLEQIVELAESMLEKEKEFMQKIYDNAKATGEMDEAVRTFNTKEK